MSAVSLAVPAVAPDPAILVVDDNPVKRVALRAMLVPLGYAVVEAESGRVALTALERQAFALILMDVRMPILNGFETAKLCRRQIRGARTPIIFITAQGGDEGEVASAYASGAVDFIFTPVLPNVLRAKVTAFVNLYLQSQALQRSLESITTLNGALRDSDVRTQAVLDNVADAIFILDEGGVIDAINRSVGRLFGYHAGEPVGHPFAFMIAPECRDALRGLDAVLTRARGTPNLSTETLGRRADGSTFAVELECGEMQHDERTFTLVCVRDISERRAHTDALEHLALHDGLTGLANRTLFGDLLARSLASARRADEPRAVLMMDLDGFKNINDTLGHDRGDTLLKQVGERLVETLRESDTVARLGGDEFAILPAEATDLQSAVAVALKIQQACELPFTTNGETMHVSPSIGIARFPEHGTTSAELLHRADLAMYSAKRAGDGHAVFVVGQETNTADHLSLLQDLGRCVSRDELVLHYQPKIALATGRITGVEALVRWQHPSLGLLSPGRFMPEVERTHLIATPLARSGRRPDDGRQRLRPQSPCGEHASRSGGRADPAVGHRARASDARAHRERADRRCRRGRPEPSARDGSGAVDRRLRRRILLAGLSASPAGGGDQDRSVLRHEPRIRQRRCDHRSLDDRTRPQTRPAGHRRGSRGCGRCKNPR